MTTMPIFAFGDKLPRIAADAFVAPTASIVGDVEIGAAASVWFGATVRGDFGSIRIGAGSCVQDNAVVHSAPEELTVVGTRVAVGHGAVLEACIVEDGAVIGTGAVVLHGARVGAGSVVAAGSVVLAEQEIPPGVLVAGSPAVVKKTLGGAARWWSENAAVEYQRLAARYRAAGAADGSAR